MPSCLDIFGEVAKLVLSSCSPEDPQGWGGIRLEWVAEKLESRQPTLGGGGSPQLGLFREKPMGGPLLGAAGWAGTRGGVPQGEKGAKHGELCSETPGVQGWLTPEKQGSAGAEFSPQASLKYIIGVLGKLSGPDLGKVLLESRKEIRRRARENFPPLQEFLDWQAKGTEKGRRPEKLTKRRFLPGVQPQDPPSNRKKFLRNPMGKPLLSANFWTPNKIGAPPPEKAMCSPHFSAPKILGRVGSPPPPGATFSKKFRAPKLA
jgi:hypothetical protein